MGMEQTPSRRRSPLARYAPFIVIVVIIAIVGIAIVAKSGSDDNKDKVNVTGGTTPGASTVPVFYNDAKAKGELEKYTWQDDCNTATGEVAVPVLNPPPCVPKASGDNGGATAPGVTASTDQDRLLHRQARPGR